MCKPKVLNMVPIDISLCSGIASLYSDSLQSGRFGDQMPVEARCSAPVQTGPGAHPSSYIMKTGPLPWG